MITRDMLDQRAADEAAWAACPRMKFALSGKNESCKKCPASSYYPEVERSGTQYCRYAAEKTSVAAILAYLNATSVAVPTKEIKS